MAALSAAAARLLGELERLAPGFAPHLERADRQARLPEAIAAPLLRAGFFRLWIPRAYAGLELPLPEALRIYEATAAVDGSLGWAVMIGAGGGLFAAWLPEQGARELFTPPAALVAGSGSPAGSAERVPGGYRVRGRWRFASLAHQASVFTAACIVTQGGRTVLDAAGEPLVRAMAIAPADVCILDSWDPCGMRGTGSHDFEVHEAQVPEHHSFSVITDAPRERGALYRLPFGVLTELPVSAVGVGIARHALALFAQALPAQKDAAGSALVQGRFAQAQAQVELAAGAVRLLAEEAWDTVSAGRGLTAAQLARITATCCVSQEQLRGAIGALAAVAGMQASDSRSAFARAWRDLQTLGAHGSLAPQRLGACGAALLAQAGRNAVISAASDSSGAPHTLPSHT